MLDNRDYWNKYFENLKKLSGDDKEIAEYLQMLIDKSSQLANDRIDITEYKKIPYISQFSQPLLSEWANKMRIMCDRFESGEIFLEEILAEVNFEDLKETDRENYEKRRTINYIKNRLIEFYWG